jgi:uncharacterized protein DUF1706
MHVDLVQAHRSLALSLLHAPRVLDGVLNSYFACTPHRLRGSRDGLTGFLAQAIILTVLKKEMLSEIAAARDDLNRALDGLAPDKMLITGVVGIWSIKDVLAHLVAWESEVVTALNHVQNKRMPAILKVDDIDEWNAEQYRISVRRPLEAVLADFEGVHRMLRQMVADFDEQHLTDRRRYRWMEGEPLWALVEENVVLHEREHAEEITAWRSHQAR